MILNHRLTAKKIQFEQLFMYCFQLFHDNHFNNKLVRSKLSKRQKNKKQKSWTNEHLLFQQCVLRSIRSMENVFIERIKRRKNNANTSKNICISVFLSFYRVRDVSREKQKKSLASQTNKTVKLVLKLKIYINVMYLCACNVYSVYGTL